MEFIADIFGLAAFIFAFYFFFMFVVLQYKSIRLF